jgi:hypothetical protein
LCMHADELYAKRIAKCRGWGLEHKDYPHCASHGPMIADLATVDVDGQWSVPFRCRSAVNRCASITKSTCPTYVEPLAPTRPRGTRRAKADNGVVGACSCAATCRRSCPCASAKEKCTPACHVTSKVCANKEVGASSEHTPADEPPRVESV